MAEEKWQIHAHRGGRSEFDENTLSAFQASYAAGLRGFETDVRMCKDGALVIMHDASVERMTLGAGEVENLTEAELRRVRSRKGNPILFLDEMRRPRPIPYSVVTSRVAPGARGAKV